MPMVGEGTAKYPPCPSRMPPIVIAAQAPASATPLEPELDPDPELLEPELDPGPELDPELELVNPELDPDPGLLNPEPEPEPGAAKPELDPDPPELAVPPSAVDPEDDWEELPPSSKPGLPLLLEQPPNIAAKPATAAVTKPRGVLQTLEAIAVAGMVVPDRRAKLTEMGTRLDPRVDTVES